jgi:hypothetical protein
MVDNSIKPNYYNSYPDGFRPRQVINAWGLGFELGNAVKYISRAGKKPGQPRAQDLRKAIEYLELRKSDGFDRVMPDTPDPSEVARVWQLSPYLAEALVWIKDAAAFLTKISLKECSIIALDNAIECIKNDLNNGK